MNTDALLRLAEDHDYSNLFLRHLGWNAPDHPPVTLAVPDRSDLTAINVSSYKGIRVWACPTRPGSRLEAELDRQLAKVSTDRLVIFHDDDEQVWRWPVRRFSGGTAITTRLTSHRHRTGVANAGFVNRLAAIQLPDDVALDATSVLAKVRAAFDTEAQNETKRASKLMARMYAAMETSYPAATDAKQRDHEISVTLARILFMMFGDDTDMWGTDRTDTFRTFVHRTTAADGGDIGSRLNTLFEHLDTPDQARRNPDLAAFPYVNGGIFGERVQLPRLNAQFRDVLLEACIVDWTTISPAIFGSMFQSVRDAATRRELGEHYTSEQNILRTLEPLFLDELQAEIQHARTLKNEAAALRRLRARLGRIRFLDPACGCGNFIIVAYRELRRLELDILSRLQELTGDSVLSLDPTSFLLEVTLDHFHGIEIDEWPARIAETAMFLVDRQCDLELETRFGEVINRLPIRTQAKIVVDNALRTDWQAVCPISADVVIAGNPPFLGHATRSEEQAQELRDAWQTDDISRLDYVTGWHAKTLQYFGATPGRWAFVTTNSITQGDPVPHLFGPIFAAGWRIAFAHLTFPWTSEAIGKAAVHCVIVGFTRDTSATPRLFNHDGSKTVESRPSRINAYLADGPNVLIRKRTEPLSPGLPRATFGNMPRDDGNLIVETEELDVVMADQIAARFVRPYVGSEELLHRKQRWCLWLTEATDDEIAASPELRRRTDLVRTFRSRSTASSTRQMAQTPHLFGQRPAHYTTPYLVIPRVSSELRDYFPTRRVDHNVVASDATFTAADPDGYVFGLISSIMFMTWQRAVGGRLKSDLRFSNTIVWNNFPVPAITVETRHAVIAAGHAVQGARDQYPEASLAQLYDPARMPHELRHAHLELDGIVDPIFSEGRRRNTEPERLSTLFATFSDLETSTLIATELPL